MALDKNINENNENFLPTQEEQELLRNVFLRSRISVPNIEEEWIKLSNDIRDENLEELGGDSNDNQGEKPEKKSRRLFYVFIGGIAAACLILAFFFPSTQEPMLPANVASLAKQQKEHDVIVCDENDHTTSLASNDFSLKDENKSIEKSEKYKIVTPRGKDCHITLSDGTKVWLNAESELDVPARFGDSKRKVYLKGEAYFEVTKDKQHPFVVENEYFTTTVLGTVFNVRAFDKGDANVVLISGKVAVNTGVFSDTFYVKPGQKAVCKGRNNWQISEEDTYPYTQRKDGYFYFDHSTLHMIMAEIGRWYNKTVVFENTDIMSMRLHFVAERSATLEKVIEQLNQMDGLDIVDGKNEILVR